MQPGLENYFSEAQRRNYERGGAAGEAKGKAEAVLKILMRRDLALTANQRRRIVGCTDPKTLEALAGSVTVRKVGGRAVVAISRVAQRSSTRIA